MEIRKQCHVGVKIIRCRGAIDSLSHPPDQAVQNANQENLFFVPLKDTAPYTVQTKTIKLKTTYCVCYKQEGRGFDSWWCHWKFFIDVILPTYPLAEMGNRDIFWGGGKGGRCVGLTTLSLSCADSLENRETQAPWTFCTCNMPVLGLL